MIESQVTLDAWNELTRDIESWLNRYVGQRAKEADQIDSSRPWGAKYQFGRTTYYFAREEDATLFRLRWA